MNEKLNIQDIADELANKHGLSKKNAEAFVKDFFALIEEALEKDKYVKIKGFGTFKLIDVDSRESINVNTGERFEIQGHSKISFTPDASLKESVNKPFSAFETVVLSDNATIEETIEEAVADEGIMEEEKTEDADIPTTEETPEEELVETPIVELPTGEEVEAQEVEKSPVAEESPIDEENSVEKEAPVIEEATPVVEEEPINEEVAVEEAVEEKVEEKTVEGQADVKILPIFDDEEIKKRSQPVSHQDEVKALRLSDEKRKEISRKAEGSSTPYLMFLAVLVIMFCLGAVAYLYYPDLAVQEEVQPVIIVDRPATTPIEEETQVEKSDSETVDSTQKESASANEQEISTPTTNVGTGSTTTAPESGKVTEPAAAPTENNGVQKLVAGVPYVTDGDLATHTMKAGESLNAISRKYYGVNGLYTYIVNYNKNIIKNPDNVPVGTVIKIPKLVRK